MWCSWYAYYETITETQLAEDVVDLTGLPFDVVQIDGGWEEMVGDWEPNAKFPSGTRSLADRITDAGFIAGLWLAPFIALPTSRVVAERPELLLRNASGEPVVAGYNWGGPYFALDLTRADARDHVAALVHKVVHEWGYTYLKLDCINAAAARDSISTLDCGLRQPLGGDDTELRAIFDWRPSRIRVDLMDPQPRLRRAAAMSRGADASGERVAGERLHLFACTVG